MNRRLALIGMSLLIGTTAAYAVQSSIQKVSSEPVEVVWRKLGDFCGIANWGGGIAKCDLSPDKKRRTLTLKNGAVVIEELVKWDEARHYYTYKMVSSPLPVDHYESTISVSEAKGGHGSLISWVGSYTSKGASDAAAKQVIDGIYRTGVDGLVDAGTAKPH